MDVSGFMNWILPGVLFFLLGNKDLTVRSLQRPPPIQKQGHDKDDRNDARQTSVSSARAGFVIRLILGEFEA
jgi:hypothetical protein